MDVRMPFQVIKHASEQPDIKSRLPMPMVYENVPVEPAHWDYRVETIDAREAEPLAAAQLNELGKQGWLLVSILDQGATGRGSLIHYYFVRQRAE